MEQIKYINNQENSSFLESFIDYDHDRGSTTCHSTTGIVCNLEGRSDLTWLSQIQPNVPISSTESNC